MSIKSDESNTLADDEKLIDDLYAQLNDESALVEEDSLSEEKPSLSLDQKIIAAAHQSVSDNIVSLTDKKAKKEPRHKAWYFPVGIAASAILAVSLVVNQNNEVQLTAAPPLEVTYTDAEMAMVQSKKEKAEVQQLEAMQSRQSQQRQRSAHLSAQQNLARKKPAPMTADEIKPFAREINPIIPSVSSLSADTEQFESLILKLSDGQYQQFLTENKQWSAVTEDDDSYVIKVLNSSGEAEQYILIKDKYLISDFSLKNIKKLNFSDIKLKHSIEK